MLKQALGSCDTAASASHGNTECITAQQSASSSSAVGLGEDVTAAQAQAASLVEAISWDDVYYRTDIGYRAIARES